VKFVFPFLKRGCRIEKKQTKTGNDIVLVFYLWIDFIIESDIRRGGLSRTVTHYSTLIQIARKLYFCTGSTQKKGGGCIIFIAIAHFLLFLYVFLQLGHFKRLSRKPTVSWLKEIDYFFYSPCILFQITNILDFLVVYQL
jgi:hypothetical protein